MEYHFLDVPDDCFTYVIKHILKKYIANTLEMYPVIKKRSYGDNSILPTIKMFCFFLLSLLHIFPYYL